jgi:hypothetical protein
VNWILRRKEPGMEMLSGYHHPYYASSLAEFGEPLELKKSGGWILKRQIPASTFYDGIGCYPLFTCNNWQLLHLDIADLQDDLISMTIVTDPFANVEPSVLEKCFDIVNPFKNHYVMDLNQSWENNVHRCHKQKIQKALDDMIFEISHDPLSYLDEWTRLYETLIQRHKISGVKAFSKECFRKQLMIPGMVLILGKLHGEVVGANLILMRNDVAYDHLAAYSSVGYQYKAAYGIFWTTFKYLSEQGIRYCDIGAGAGLESDSRDGLDQFKRGWTKNRRIVYLCGRINNSAVYNELCQKRTIPYTKYFPAYRCGEFS